jgi:hypothetical protein
MTIEDAFRQTKRRYDARTRQGRRAQAFTDHFARVSEILNETDRKTRRAYARETAKASLKEKT